MREELISDPKVTIGASVVADYRAEHPAASPDGLKVLVALFHSPALRELADDARVGEWVDYKTINESDRPHGFAGRQVSGLIAGLQRRGLVECRMDKPGKYLDPAHRCRLRIGAGGGPMNDQSNPRSPPSTTPSTDRLPVLYRIAPGLGSSRRQVA